MKTKKKKLHTVSEYEAAKAEYAYAMYNHFAYRRRSKDFRRSEKWRKRYLRITRLWPVRPLFTIHDSVTFEYSLSDLSERAEVWKELLKIDPWMDSIPSCVPSSLTRGGAIVTGREAVNSSTVCQAIRRLSDMARSLNVGIIMHKAPTDEDMKKIASDCMEGSPTPFIHSSRSMQYLPPSKGHEIK